MKIGVHIPGKVPLPPRAPFSEHTNLKGVVKRALLCLRLSMVAWVLVGCAGSRTNPPPDPPAAATKKLKDLLETRWPIHTNPPDTNFHQVFWTNITLQWTNSSPLDPNWSTDYVTGLVAAPALSGPWTEITNVPYAPTNRVTIGFRYDNRFFRAFNRLKP